MAETTQPAQPAQTTQTAQVDRIVVGVDGSISGDRALRWAVEEGRIRGVEVVALLAWSYLDQPARPGSERFDPHYDQASARTALAAFVTRAVGEAGVIEEVVCDLPAQALLEAAGPHDLLVVGARGLGGFRGLLLGSVSRRCTHHAAGPVAIVREEPDLTARGPVVVGVDGSPASAGALRWAVGEAAVRGSRIQVLHAWYEQAIGLAPYGFDPDGGLWEKSARSLVEDMIETAGATGTAEPLIVHGGATAALVEASKTAALVVVASRGHGALGTLLGSVAQQTAHHTHCPLVLIPTPH